MSHASQLRYDPETHTTVHLADGRDVPHVTAVLAAVGVATVFDDLPANARRYAADARLRGTAVHADCHALDDGDLAWDTVHPLVRPYVLAWQAALTNLALVPVHRERQVFHPSLRYTGITDGVFHRRGIGLVLGDIKTGDPEDAAAHLQTSAYEGAWNYEHPDELIAERWAIWLQPEKRVPYKVINYSARPEAPRDWPTWLACLTVYNEQPARRRRQR